MPRVREKRSRLGQIIETILRRGDRLIIVDPNGTFLSRYFFPGDVILNPFDKRSEGWSIFNELRDAYDFKRYALSVVPKGLTDEAEEWNGYARLLFQAATRKMASVGNTDIFSLIKLLSAESDESLKEFLTDTEAEGLFVGAKQALSSARFILAKYLDPHQYLKDGGAFSIRRWLENEAGGNLYITWREDMLEALKPLVSTWVDILCTSILSLPESPDGGALDGDRRARQPAEAALPGGRVDQGAEARPAHRGRHPVNRATGADQRRKGRDGAAQLLPEHSRARRRSFGQQDRRGSEQEPGRARGRAGNAGRDLERSWRAAAAERRASNASEW